MAISTIGYAALGLIIIYFLAAVLTSHGLEVISSYLDKRAALLQQCIKDLVQINTSQTGVAPSASEQIDGQINVALLANSVYDHGLVNGLLPGAKNPSYVPAANFVMAFLYRLSERANAVNTAVNVGAPALDTIAKQIAFLPDDCALKGTLQALDKQAEGNIETFTKLLQTHYNNVMDRMAGAYKKWSRQISIIVALIVAVGLNLDSVMIFRAIDTDVRLQEAIQKTSVLVESNRAEISAATARQACVPDATGKGCPTPPTQPPSTASQTATSTSPTPAGPTPRTTTDEVIALFSSVVKPLLDARLPIGWSVPENNAGCLVTPFVHILKVTKAPGVESVEYTVICWSDAAPKDYLFKLVGWLITAFAASLGAPFWFNLFETIVRQTGIKPSTEKAAKTR